MNSILLKFAFHTAAANWNLWRNDYEYTEYYKKLPVFSNQNRFEYFLNSYSAGRGISSQTRNEIRETLNSGEIFSRALANESGAGVDRLVQDLSERYGKRRSLISKLALFARPDIFSPWDRFAVYGRII